MKIEQISVSKIKPYERNAKLHPPEQVEHIANSIKEFGWQQPIVLDKENVVIIGHGRLQAAKMLGLDKVPCLRAETLTEAQIKALRLADNKTNESAWDFELLDEELDDIIDIDMERFGFEVQDGEEQETKENPEVEFGEIIGEENNYIVLQFKTDVDWINAQSVFGLKTVKSYSTRKDGEVTKNMEMRGTPRIIDGAAALNMLLGEI